MKNPRHLIDWSLVNWTDNNAFIGRKHNMTRQSVGAARRRMFNVQSKKGRLIPESMVVPYIDSLEAENALHLSMLRRLSKDNTKAVRSAVTEHLTHYELPRNQATL